MFTVSNVQHLVNNVWGNSSELLFRYNNIIVHVTLNRGIKLSFLFGDEKEIVDFVKKSSFRTSENVLLNLCQFIGSIKHPSAMHTEHDKRIRFKSEVDSLTYTFIIDPVFVYSQDTCGPKTDVFTNFCDHIDNYLIYWQPISDYVPLTLRESHDIIRIGGRVDSGDNGKRQRQIFFRIVKVLITTGRTYKSSDYSYYDVIYFAKDDLGATMADNDEIVGACPLRLISNYLYAIYYYGSEMSHDRLRNILLHTNFDEKTMHVTEL